MPFFHYKQKNSGGRFLFDSENGISVNVVVEADDSKHANYRAQLLGLYFHGMDDRRDCRCCGDRWYGMEDWDRGDEVPSCYGTPVEAYTPLVRWWAHGKPETFVHFADGTTAGYHTEPARVSGASTDTLW